MDRLPRRRRQHRVGVDAVHAILGAVILLDRRDGGGIAPAQSAVPAQRARPLPQPGHPARNGDVSIESHPRNSAGKDTYSWPSRPHRQPERAAARSRPRNIRPTAGRTNPRPRPPSVPPAANDPRRAPSPVAAIRASVPFASTPVGWNSRAWRMGGAGLNRQGGDVGDLHSPGCPARCSGKPHERFITGDRGH